MYLSDTQLAFLLAGGELRVVPSPLDKDIQPCSIDLHLGDQIAYYARHTTGSKLAAVDLRKGEDIEKHYTFVQTEGFVLRSGAFVLGSTAEAVSVSDKLCAHVDGRSTLGRLGLMVHVTAGFIDPGFQGHITLELHNTAPYDLILSAGIGIGQLLVSRVDGRVARPYGSEAVGSKYGGFQSGPVPPKLGRKL